MPPDDYRRAIRSLHTNAVASTIAAATPNRVLGFRPPVVDSTELTLSRPSRTTLAQLRSGFCSALQSYKHRIGVSDDPSCPECHLAEHSVSHLFSCPAYPTSLVPLSLWVDPIGANLFLSSLPAFSFLPPPPRPPPEPPPELAQHQDG